MSIQPSASTVDEATRPKASLPSGRLLLRMSPGLHAELARTAEQRGVSLNGFITSRLAESVDWDAGEPVKPAVSSQRAALPPALARLLLLNAVAVTLAAGAAVAVLLVAWLG